MSKETRPQLTVNQAVDLVHTIADAYPGSITDLPLCDLSVFGDPDGRIAMYFQEVRLVPKHTGKPKYETTGRSWFTWTTARAMSNRMWPTGLVDWYKARRAAVLSRQPQEAAA